MRGNKIKLITEILVIIMIILISLVGIYGQEANKMKNQVKDFELNKDLNGYRELIFEVSNANQVTDSNGKVIGSTDDYSDSTIESNSYQKTEQKVNGEEELNIQNYEKAKSIIEDRLKSLQVTDYQIALDTENGKIYLQIPEDSTTDHTVSNILQVANFSIRDSEDRSKVLLTNEDLKNVAAVYNTTSSGTTVYLQFEFNKNGKNTLKEISSGEYATKEEAAKDSGEDQNTTVEADVTTEDGENSEENTEETESAEDSQKKIILAIDNNDMITTSFDTIIEDGVIDLSMNQESTDNDSISETLQSTSTIALLLNSGKMPLTYKVSSNHYVKSDISQGMIQKVIYGIAIIIVLAVIWLILKYKMRGFIAGVAYLGFIALYLLVVRYTNVSITLESMVATVIVLVLNYFITYQLTKINETEAEAIDEAYTETFKTSILKLIPIFLVSVVFSFVEWARISTFGMFLFWGILLSIIYNYLLTRDMLDS